MSFCKRKFVQITLGILIGMSIAGFVLNTESVNRMRNVMKYNSNLMAKNAPQVDDRTLADEMFKKVRVLCWVMTNPKNHKTKAIHVKNTWGKRCNKLLFMSSETDLELGSVALPVNEGRDNLWDKTKSAFQYVYQNHFDEADWFLKADDDSYVILENMRYMLAQYRASTSLFFGCRFANNNNPEGYMSGGGYILSKKALSKFNQKILNNGDICKGSETGDEDFEMGRCLAKSAIFVDTRDDLNQMRFFPITIYDHMSYIKDSWYNEYLYYDFPRGSLDCCSKSIAVLHYITPQQMYYLDYLIYNVNPFGLQKRHEEWPRNFTLKEIIAASDVEGIGALYVKHDLIHDMDDSEIF